MLASRVARLLVHLSPPSAVPARALVWSVSLPTQIQSCPGQIDGWHAPVRQVDQEG
jgi:hypothetical protein